MASSCADGNLCISTVEGDAAPYVFQQRQCEYFAVYCEELNKVYLIPVDQVGINSAHLRLTPPKNKNQHGYRMAADYEL